MKSLMPAVLLISLALFGYSQEQKTYYEKADANRDRIKAVKASLEEQRGSQREYLKYAFRNDKVRNHAMVFMEVSETGHFVFVDDHIPSHLGWYKSEMYGKTYKEFVHPDDLQPSIEVSNGTSIFATRNTYNGFFWNRYITKWGEYKYFWWKLNWVEPNGHSYHIAEVFTEDEWHELQNVN